jgi:ATP-dependent Clp protease ATP-binding subunit ClpB
LKRLEALLAERRIALELDEAAERWLAEAGYDPVYGARPLKRVIQRQLQDPLARLVLEGRVAEGGRVRALVGPAGLVLEAAPPAATDGGERPEPAGAR